MVIIRNNYSHQVKMRVLGKEQFGDPQNNFQLIQILIELEEANKEA